MQNTVTVNYSDFNPEKLSFTKLEENERSNGQLIGYPRFSHDGKDSGLELQLPWIKLTTYGVPTLNDKTKKYYKNDTDRAHIRLPLDLQITEVSDMVEKLKAIDKMMADPETAKKLLGKNYKKYKYSNSFREIVVSPTDDDASDSEDESANQKKETKPIVSKLPYIKLKLDLTWPENNVRTKVFSSELDIDTNKRSRAKIDVTTVDDFASIVRYQSTIRCIAKPFKAWAHPLTKKDPEYGIGWKVIRVEVDKAEGSSVYKSIYESDKFIDSDTEEELPKVQQINVAEESSDEEDDEPEPVVQESQKKIVEVDTSDDEEEEEEEEEVKPPPPPVVKKTKSTAKAKSKA